MAASFRIPIPGLTCADGACAALAAALRGLTGVSDVYADPSTESVYVVATHELDLDHILPTIAALGHAPLPPQRLPFPEHDGDLEQLDAIRTSHLDPKTPGSDHERVHRIAREAAQAFDALRPVQKAVAVFGSARPDPADRHHQLARSVVERISRAGFSVITGGGPGLMEVKNRAARQVGGSSVGLTIQLPHEQASNPWLQLDVPFRYFFLRKLAFVKYACAFVCLPGGFGTLDELFEALNLKVTHKVAPFPVILVGTEYWGGLVTWLQEVVAAEGALSPAELATFIVTDDAGEVVDAITACHDTLCRRLGLHVRGDDRG